MEEPDHAELGHAMSNPDDSQHDCRVRHPIALGLAYAFGYNLLISLVVWPHQKRGPMAMVVCLVGFVLLIVIPAHFVLQNRLGKKRLDAMRSRITIPVLLVAGAAITILLLSKSHLSH